MIEYICPSCHENLGMALDQPHQRLFTSLKELNALQPN